MAEDRPWCRAHSLPDFQCSQRRMPLVKAILSPHTLPFAVSGAVRRILAGLLLPVWRAGACGPTIEPAGGRKAAPPSPPAEVMARDLARRARTPAASTLLFY